MTAAPRIRSARRADLPRVVALAAEHAAYEKAPPPDPDLGERLAALLSDMPQPRLACLVADSAGGEVVGYATCSPEVSTWQGREYLNMDCLFPRDGTRGQGTGALLVDAVVAEARRRGLDEVQWQTPAWNDDAARFHDRLGARSKKKLRYSLPTT
jgi:ribosomal protein S18 acetylase RimI-like enzyme